MTATVTTPSTTHVATATARGSLWRTGLVAAVLAAAATEVYTAVLRAAGLHLAVGNIGGSADDVVPIGAGACTIMVATCVAAGLVLAAGLNRWAKRPAHTFRTATYALVVLSFVPDALAGATATSSKIALVGAHVIAAAIVIPLVSRTLRTSR